MTYEMKDFQEDEKTLRKQAKDGEISEEEFFIAIRKLHNRATEGESKANELSPEAQCPNCGSYKTILEGKSSLGYGKRKQYVCQNCYNVFQSEHSPKEIRAMYGDHPSPYDRQRWGWGESKAIENNPYYDDGVDALDYHDDDECPIGQCPIHDDYREPEDSGLTIGDLKRKYGESKASEDFKEDDHPREEDGKFAKKGSGSSSGGKSKTAMRKERTRSLVKSNLNDSQRKTLDRFFDNNKMGMPKFDSIRSAGKDWDMKKDLTQTQVKELEGVDKSDILDYLKKRIASKDQWHKDADVRNEKQAKQDKIDSRKRKKRQRELEKHEKEVEQRLERREKYISENPELMKGQTRDAINQLNKPQKARIEDLANRYRKDNYLSSEDEREDLANVIDMMDDYGTLDDYTDKELELVLFFATARMKNNLDNYDNKDQVLYSKMMDIYNSSDFVEESKATERRGVWEIPNFWHGREPDEDTMKDYERVESLGIENGDLVDFGSYGKLYVLSTDYGAGWGSDSLDMWVTEDEEDRFNPEARGNSIGPYHAVSVIEKGSSVDMEDFKNKFTEDEDDDYYGESKANEMGSWQGVEHWWNGITENDRDSIIGTIVGQKVVSKWGLHDLRTMKWNDIPSDARLLLEAQIEGWDTSQYSVMEESKEEDDKLQKSVMSMYPTKQDVEDRYNARNEESNANEGKTCQACGGYGEIKKGGSKEWEDCPKCGGSGEIGSESRHHEQINVEKKWLERCEVCGDIRASHTNGIDHKFEVDATGTEFLDPKYLNGLGESALFKKNISVEMVRLSTMREAHTWWDRKHAGTYGRKYWKDMNIRERQKVILAYLKTVTGFGGGIPLVESRARGVRKYAFESKRVKFENPDPKFWWNDGEARTGTVLNEYKQSGLEWYSVNSGGQLYNILKNDAELIASEHDPSEEDLGFKRCPECGILLNDHRMRNHFENEHNTFINEYLWKDNLYLVENDHRNYSAIESDEEAQALLTDVTELGLLNDLKDNEESEQEKGEDEAEDLDLIEQLMDIEEDEIKEKIEEATPNSLIRYANPRKLPNGKTIMDRVRTSHPQVNEHHLHNPLHISKHHQGDFSVTQICTECGQVIKGDPITVDEASIKHVNETGHNSFSVKVDESIDILGNIPFEAISTMAWNNLSPVIKEKIKAKISKEYWNDGTLNTTGEWWDLQDYGFKWTTLSNLGFAKSDELAKAYWTHLPMNVQNVVKRYRGIHFPDVLGLEGKQIQIGHKNHNIHKYLDKSLQDYLSGNKSDNDEYDELRNVSDAEWESTGHPREDDGKFKAKEDSLIKIEDDKDDNTQVTVLDEWKNETHPDKNGKTKGIRTTKSVEGDLENLIDMYSDTTQMPRGFIQNPSEPLGGVFPPKTGYHSDNIEECPFCGKEFDQFNLDFHVEQEHGVHTPSQYTQSTIMDNLDDEWLGEAWDKMSAKERRKLLGESKVECSRCGERFDEENTEGMKRHEEGRHTQQKSASTNYDYGKVEWVPLGTYKPLYESKANEHMFDANFDPFPAMNAIHEPKHFPLFPTKPKKESDDPMIRFLYDQWSFDHTGTWQDFIDYALEETDGAYDEQTIKDQSRSFTFESKASERDGFARQVWNEWKQVADFDIGGIGTFMYDEWREFALDRTPSLTDKQIDEQFELHHGKPYSYTNVGTDIKNYEDSFNVSFESKASEFEKNIWDDLPENPTKSQIKKAIRKLQDFIYYASIENPMHMGEFESRLKDLKEKLESYESKATEEKLVGDWTDYFNSYGLDDPHIYCKRCNKEFREDQYEELILGNGEEMKNHLKDEHGITESKANEGGFGSGRKGHSAWMKDIEWGGNYKQCPICNINTNFTSGKCEICGNSFA